MTVEIKSPLSEKCKGCQHIRGRHCPYYTTPRQVKHPCYFRREIKEARKSPVFKGKDHHKHK